MTGEVEAWGALTTAGLVASVVDRPAAHGHGHDAACANCDTPLVGDYCHACGQQGHVHRSIGHIFEEFLHGLYHFDSKAWRTLPLLIFRPGRLTWDYVHGKRARFIAPLALFLLTMFLMFFVFGLLGGPDLDGAVNPTVNSAQKIADARKKVADVETEIATAKADGNVPGFAIAALDVDLKGKRDALAAAERTGTSADAAAKTPRRHWQDIVRRSADDPSLTINTGSGVVNERIREAMRNPDFALYRIQQKAYKLSFLLVPLSLPALWLMLFWRRDVRTFDHVVFALYSLSFMSLLFIVIALIGKIGGGGSQGLAGLLCFVPPFHIYAQLKGGYRLSTFGALWRTGVLSVSSIVTLSLFAALIVVVGLAD